MATPDVIVIGAGVNGLSTAIVLAEAGAVVRIVAAEPTADTTSAAATGMCGPVFHGPDPRTATWETATVAHLTALAGRAGVRMSTGLAAGPASVGGAPPLADPAALVREATPDELPAGFGFGMWLHIPLVDLPVYLAHLQERFAAAGGEIVAQRIDAFTELSAPVLVNCSGVGARRLCGDDDVRPVRGQHVVVENPGLDGFFMPAPGPQEWASYHVHGDHVLLGGVAVEDGWDPAPSERIAAGILERCIALEPRLAGARVLEQRAGLRPVRSRVRLEVEQVGTTRVVHNYGHGGSGVIQSWGCAVEAAALAGVIPL